ncbi:relaxase/mobilization nuclease domain-containing protein [Acidithiobacillus thiooxidans]|uniref:relaxase/mobilization nuclease domain-containing protein n=1 Tax=Acidithiobacillus thiooxidans TaxID=930 RepID=UPI00285A3A13|nr:relaxase/mobilization nuclease domain-containing protein [Acidithiobacillus thiooxidans]MDR7927439.1 relaxase/mobilization nuclease domain-containing protein [Acidithiobacillus thiooxidans]
MIEKIIKGTGARGLANYLLAEKDHNGAARPRHDLIGGTLSGRSARELAAEIGALRRMRPNLQKAVGHVSLRVPEGDRVLSDQEWAMIGDQWCSDMGMDAYATVCHGDHIHILFSRINSDGSVVSDSHDYRRGEAAVRKIEQDFDLVKVEPSSLLEPENALNHKKAPTQGDFMAMGKGEVPARLFMQQALDALLEKKPTVTQFIEDLEALGVIVEPNLATTGKLSGFAYHYGDYRFTSNSLGRGYRLSNMQKKGLSYEQDRDIERIHAAKDQTARFLADRRAGDDPANPADATGAIAVTGGDGKSDSRELGTHGENGSSPGSGTGYTEGDYAAFDRGRRGRHPERDADAFAGQSEADRENGQGISQESDAIKSGIEALEAGSKGFTGGDSKDTATVLDSGRISGDTGSGRDRDDSGIVTVTNWNDRFKKASAAKRRAKEQPDPDKQNYSSLRDAAHMADLVAYLQSIGLPVKKSGVKDWVVDDRYRVTQEKDGYFVWCDWEGADGGDPIDFCVKEMGLSFQQALANLSGSTITKKAEKRTVLSHQLPVAPPVCRNSDPVMQYLQDRGISQKTIRSAQGAGFLRFVDYKGIPSVAFCGRGDGQLRSMTLRLIQSIQSWDGKKPLTKLEVKHSDKSYPAIWRGDDPSSVWVVEGGIDALAVIDWYKTHRKPIPSVIVSGGAGVRSFLDQTHVQKILKEADTVYVAMEREKNTKIQAKTDAAHEQQIDTIWKLGCEKVFAWMPPVDTKDIADAWKAGALPEPHDPLAHMRKKIGDESASISPQAPAIVSTFDWE